MSAQRLMDMRNFFSSVKKKDLHRANMRVQRFYDDEKEEKSEEARKKLRKDIAEQKELRTTHYIGPPLLVPWFGPGTF